MQLSRIFDVNRDGFVNKKEFQWMTTNDILNKKKIDIMFKVSAWLHHSLWLMSSSQRCDLDGDGKLNQDEFTRWSAGPGRV
jgi:hypothetical protein